MSRVESINQKVVELNHRYNIRFEKPDPGFLPGVQALVDKMASVVGVQSQKLDIPQSGFLVSPLTQDQSKAVNDQIGPLYAKRSVDFQKNMMDIPIRESGEKMVDLRKVFTDPEDIKVSFSDKPFHPASLNEWAGKPRVFWVREDVSERIKLAAKALNEVGLMMYFEDGFRPVGVQEGLLKRRITEFVLTDHPDWDPVQDFDKIMTEAQSKTAVMPRIAGHKGGAAVDVTLHTINGEVLPLGNEYPQGDALVNMDCPYVTKEEWQTRMIFKTVMEMVGMTVYPGEDWHASYGDNLAGANSDGSPKEGYIAKYGPIKKFDPETGAIEPYENNDYNLPFFTREELQQFAVEARKK